jgi:hypothetical protein
MELFAGAAVAVDMRTSFWRDVPPNQDFLAEVLLRK